MAKDHVAVKTGTTVTFATVEQPTSAVTTTHKTVKSGNTVNFVTSG